jgi:hypothetical protein
VVDVTEHKRHVEHVHFGHDRADHAQRNTCHLNGTDLHLFNDSFFFTQHGAREHLDGQAPAGGCIELLAHVFHGNYRGVTRRVRVGRLEHNIVSSSGQACGQGHHCDGCSEKGSTEGHGYLLS